MTDFERAANKIGRRCAEVCVLIMRERQNVPVGPIQFSVPKAFYKELVEEIDNAPEWMRKFVGRAGGWGFGRSVFGADVYPSKTTAEPTRFENAPKRRVAVRGQFVSDAGAVARAFFGSDQ